MSKERVGRRFEFLFWEVSRRRSVVLTEIIDDAVVAEPEPISEYLCGVAGFALVAREDAAHPSCPGMGWAIIARMRAWPRSLSGHSGTGTLGSIAISGWVMKKTVGTEFLPLPPRARTLSHMPPAV